MMSLWPKQEHLCHSGASLALLALPTDKQKQLCLNIVYRHRWGPLAFSISLLGIIAWLKEASQFEVWVWAEGRGAWRLGRAAQCFLVVWQQLVIILVARVPCVPWSPSFSVLCSARWSWSWIRLSFLQGRSDALGTQGWCFCKADLHESHHRITES